MASIIISNCREGLPPRDAPVVFYLDIGWCWLKAFKVIGIGQYDWAYTGKMAGIFPCQALPHSKHGIGHGQILIAQNRLNLPKSNLHTSLSSKCRGGILMGIEQYLAPCARSNASGRVSVCRWTKWSWRWPTGTLNMFLIIYNPVGGIIGTERRASPQEFFCDGWPDPF